MLTTITTARAVMPKPAKHYRQIRREERPKHETRAVLKGAPWVLGTGCISRDCAELR